MNASVSEANVVLDYTPQELMVAAAAREIADGELVFVGMRLPLLAFLLAKRSHAPSALGLFENGVIRDTAAPRAFMTMGDPVNLTYALKCTEMKEIMAYLQRGRVNLGFVGGAEIDRFGNLNTSMIGRPGEDGFVRLPGSGGGSDIACLAQRLLIIMAHQKRRFKEKVSYITSPGYGDGGSWRTGAGLIRGGPKAVITTMGILRFDPETREAYLDSIHPGVTADEVKANTGWDLKVSTDVSVTRAPTEAELAVIREYDPQGHWTGWRKR
ncbi:MAG: CoA-transferase [Deltaproteobacteria bacterium]|nr:CoA-transferase [Deltaproteobacteria bacterium]